MRKAKTARTAGNQRKAPEPIRSSGKLAPVPSYLAGVAREHYLALQSLVDICEEDAPIFAQLCLTHAMVIEIQQAICQSGLLDDEGKRHQLLPTLRDMINIYSKLADQCGLSPYGRIKVAGSAKKEGESEDFPLRELIG